MSTILTLCTFLWNAKVSNNRQRSMPLAENDSNISHDNFGIRADHHGNGHPFLFVLIQHLRYTERDTLPGWTLRVCWLVLNPPLQAEDAAPRPKTPQPLPAPVVAAPAPAAPAVSEASLTQEQLIRQQLLAKQKQLLELQQKKIELELEQTKAQLVGVEIEMVALGNCQVEIVLLHIERLCRGFPWSKVFSCCCVVRLGGLSWLPRFPSPLFRRFAPQCQRRPSSPPPPSDRGPLLTPSRSSHPPETPG